MHTLQNQQMVFSKKKKKKETLHTILQWILDFINQFVVEIQWKSPNFKHPNPLIKN
jgi:hypothetical protein